MCDIAKIDIEGGEWDLLKDPRFPDCAPPFLIVEYHPSEDIINPVTRAQYLLSRAGYQFIEDRRSVIPGIGTLLARRDPSQTPLSASGSTHETALSSDEDALPSPHR